MTQNASTRDRVLDAIMTITADRGLDQVSIREVAAEAAVSIGTVQYYCRSKDEMLQVAFEYSIAQAIARVDAIPREGEVGPVLRRAVLEFIPLDVPRRKAARIYLAFAARAAVSANLSVALHSMMSQLRTMCAEALRTAEDRGQTKVEFDADLLAAATFALADGLLIHLLSDPEGMTAAMATAIIDAHLSRYLDVGLDK